MHIKFRCSIYWWHFRGRWLCDPHVNGSNQRVQWWKNENRWGFSHSHRGCVINRSGVITIMVRREVMDRSHLHTALRYLSLCIYDPQKRHCYIEHCCVLYFVYSSIVYSKKLTQVSWKSKQHKRPLHIWPYLNKKAKHVVNNYLNPKTAASLLQDTLHNNVTLWCFFHFITAWSTHGNRTLCRECAQLFFFMWP